MRPDDLIRAPNAAFAEHGLRALSPEQVEALIGQAATALIERALHTRGQRHLVADADRLLASFTQSSHEIYRQWKASHMDEKSASRTLALHFSIGDARTMYSLNDSNRSASPANLISNHPQSGHRRIHSADVNAVLCASRSSEWYLVAATVEVAAEHEASGLA
jgi:hypothetical protein